MTSRELEYIKTVADEKSISSAARKLYIAQPSLSQSLQRIEENLGAKLFNRTPSGDQRHQPVKNRTYRNGDYQPFRYCHPP